MIGLIRKAVSHPVAADLLFLGILGLGGIVVGTLPREVFPEFSKEAVEVQIRYPSASPDEIARLCVIPVEEAADSLEGTDEIQSWSRQNGPACFRPEMVCVYNFYVPALKLLI